MLKSGNKVEDYLSFLAEKGFLFREDARGFISFGQGFTDSNDELVNAAIEITLKAQREFDGSFFISLLETLKEKDIYSRRRAFEFARQKGMI